MRRKTMPLDLKGASGFSMPLGASLYPVPPHHFHGARQAWASYEADGGSVRSLLPPGVEPDSEPPICQLWVCDYPSTSFGPYLEAFIMVRVRLGGERYWYQPVIFTNREPALAAGREIWGFAKKLADMSWREQAEQIVFTIERPRGKRIATFTLTRDRIAAVEEIEGLPVLSLRYLPPSDPKRPPAAAELVRLDVIGAMHESPGLGKLLWAGRPSVTMDSPSTVDPWYLLAPRRILAGYVQTTDFTLPLGTVVKDYVAEGLFSGPTEARALKPSRQEADLVRS
jgi:acetoacetate decarboxylase